LTHRVRLPADCLNDFIIGPVIQQDLVFILMCFHTFQYVIDADINKMYRQVLLNSSVTEDFVVRRSTDEVNTYELLITTYGMSSASYLATRCLVHLASQLFLRYPIDAKHVACDFYMTTCSRELTLSRKLGW